MMERKLQNCQQKLIKRLSDSDNIVNILIEKRFKIRNKYISLFQGIIRFIMLYERIKLPKSNELNGIFLAFLGFLSNIVSVVKYLNEDNKKFKQRNKSFTIKRRFDSKFEVLKSFNTVFNY